MRHSRSNTNLITSLILIFAFLISLLAITGSFVIIDNYSRNKHGEEQAQKTISESISTLEADTDLETSAEYSSINENKHVVPATYGTKYGTISCGSAGISADLVWGDDYGILGLNNTVAQYTGSNQIGYGGCHLLLSHNYSVFSNLQYVSYGDVFTIVTTYGTYQYQVDQIESGYVTGDSGNIVSSDGNYLVNLQDSVDRLYMYTCYPFDFYDATEQRYVVRATRI